MNKFLEEIVLLAMQIPQTEDMEIRINELLKEYYQAENVIFQSNYNPINDGVDHLIIPITREKIIGYYDIIKPTNHHDNGIFLKDVLTQMHFNNQKYSKLKQSSYIDKSTTVYNKNSYLKYCEEFDQEMVNSLGFIILDINGLHEINNTKGHVFGDKVIFTVAQLVKKVYGNDKTFRIGGDEFVVLICDKSSDYATNKMRLIKEELAKRDIFISIGYASAEAPFIEIEKLKCLADERMYEDKENFYNNSSHERRQPR